MRFTNCTVASTLVLALGCTSSGNNVTNASAGTKDTASAPANESVGVELQGLSPDCYDVVKETRRSTGTIIRKSKEYMVFKIDKNLRGELQISNSGMPFTLGMSFSFLDDMEIGAEIGDILTVTFSDGYSIDLKPSSKTISSGTAFFDLIRFDVKGGKTVLDDSYKVMYDHLQQVDIASFKYFVANRNREIPVSKGEAEVIKRIVNCVKIE